MITQRLLLLSMLALGAALAAAAPLTVTLKNPERPGTGYFNMGTARSTDGHMLTLDSRSLLFDGEAWMPAMGEFHYTRYPAAEWREELLKMKAGGIQIVATYVFWIHHEEVEGTWDWSGDRDLRRFIETVRDVGLKVIVRCGPWCHGEVRNGGLPEWVVERQGWKLRSSDPAFLAVTRELYSQIAAQLRGLLWKDGGPVIGIQVDNEYRGPAAYLTALKGIAREVGLDVPLYTRTGWPALSTPMPLGEIVPLYGVYAEGFWDRELTSMPGRYWSGFHFSTLRTDNAIATEMLGNRAAVDEPDAAKYPYLTCEIGGGMMSSYHRRILVDPRDIETTTLIRIAGGSTLPGYYMYHGGTNPEGKRTTLMEAQDTRMTNYNDLPVKTYDFQAPLGEFGEVRPSYHRLRRLHSFLWDFGSDLCGMVPALPHRRPSGRDDLDTLRWAARSDGRRGFVFISNYERARTLPEKRDVQFALGLSDGGTLVFPSAPVTIPSGTVAWWPFNVNLGGLMLVSATAQPFAHVLESNGARTVFFAATPGVAAEFQFAAEQVAKVEAGGELTRDERLVVVRNVPTGRRPAIRLLTRSGDVVQCVLLDEADSFAFWKGPMAGRNRVFLTRANLVFDRDVVRVTPTGHDPVALSIFPAPGSLAADGSPLGSAADGMFARYELPTGVTVTQLPFVAGRTAGPMREIRTSPRKEGVAMQPTDEDFARAATWDIKLPASLDVARRPLLRIHYVGDVARVTLGDRLLTDDFYNGLPRAVGLWRYVEPRPKEPLRVAVLPLPKSAPIFLPDSAHPEFGAQPAVAAIRSVELVEAPTVTLTAKPGAELSLPLNFRTDVRTPNRGL